METVLINQQDQDEGALSSIDGKTDPPKKDCCDNKCKQLFSSTPLLLLNANQSSANIKAKLRFGKSKFSNL